jgi:hypothetical protein
VPREKDLRKARIGAREQAQKEGLDWEADADLCINLEQLHILYHATRDPSPPHGQFFATPDDIADNYDRASIVSLSKQLDETALALDPVPSELTPDQVVIMAAAISKERSISPLSVYGPGAQVFCVISMASRLTSLLQHKQSSE